MITKDEKSRLFNAIDRIDKTLHGNGKMGLKSKVDIMWYVGGGLFTVILVLITVVK